MMYPARRSRYRRNADPGVRSIPTGRRDRAAPVAAVSSVVLVRALYPDEGLQVDLIARPQVAEVAPYRRRELERARVRAPVGRRAIRERESIRLRAHARHRRLDIEMDARLRDEREDRDDRPCQHARLAARQRG